MATVVDLASRSIDKGDHIVPKNIEAYNFEVLDMGELTVRPVPGNPQAFVRTITLACQMQLQIPYIPGQVVGIPWYLVKKAEPPAQDQPLQ